MNATVPHHIILNTLGGTLRHYSRALSATLRANGDAVDELSINEPSVENTSAAGWVLRYAASLWKARRLSRPRGAGRSNIVITWPVLGYLDVLLIALVIGRRARTDIVMHDPIPLVRAVGYDSWSRRTARAVLALLGHGLIVHSDAAHDAVSGQGFGRYSVSLPHPLLVEQDRIAAGGALIEAPVVRVLGQYKADRDLQLMRRLADAADDGIRFEVHGRGWPEIDGWSVTDAFVSEERMDDLIATSSAVLVPYRRFYQSGIAIRSIESGTPIVGPAESSLAELYPEETRMLIAADESNSIQRWLDATELAIALDAEEVAGLARDADERSRRAWRGWALREGAASPLAAA